MAILEPFALAIAFLLSYSYDFTNSYGFSIVVLTVIINIIIFPLTLRQTRSTKRMQDIQPELKKLQKQHKDNKEQLNKEIAELYKTKGINPLGCVLPLIIQMPVWFALFRVLREPLEFIPRDASLFTKLGDQASILFFTMNLQIPASEIETWIDRIPYLVLILFVILTALYQQSQLTKKSGNSNNPQAQQMQMIGKIMPLFFGFISWTLPSGLVVYFLTGNIFRIGQQALIVKIEENQENKSEKKDQKEENDNSETSPIKDDKDDPRKNRKKRRRK
ncbi:MAG: membrane protein insertase YidC [Candidatus Actinomarina sp.]|nr:membrane protein insertase YidC [Actinomycetota bacterium]MBL6833025.1 membrane protein insertase YidC [Candidatus Actinomarina sp.]MBL6836895.1 membrane protein insertase YidC [Candidatus Actinomarina sp.]